VLVVFGFSVHSRNTSYQVVYRSRLRFCPVLLFLIKPRIRADLITALCTPRRLTMSYYAVKITYRRNTITAAEVREIAYIAPFPFHLSSLAASHDAYGSSTILREAANTDGPTKLDHTDGFRSASHRRLHTQPTPFSSFSVAGSQTYTPSFCHRRPTDPDHPSTRCCACR
jgi:hypothetical protein